MKKKTNLLINFLYLCGIYDLFKNNFLKEKNSKIDLLRFLSKHQDRNLAISGSFFFSKSYEGYFFWHKYNELWQTFLEKHKNEKK